MDTGVSDSGLESGCPRPVGHVDDLCLTGLLPWRQGKQRLAPRMVVALLSPCQFDIFPLGVASNVSLSAQELCESRGGRHGLPVPRISPYGLCGRKATLEEEASNSVRHVIAREIPGKLRQRRSMILYCRCKRKFCRYVVRSRK